MVRKPCRGKYRGHNDYSIVFGSGRELYIGIDQRNYVPKLKEQLGYIQYFREHQAENTEKIKAFLDAVVILTHEGGLKIRYRTTNMHYYLVGGDNGWYTFEECMAHLLEDSCGEMSYCTAHNTTEFQRRTEKRLARKQEAPSR